MCLSTPLGVGVCVWGCLSTQGKIIGMFSSLPLVVAYTMSWFKVVLQDSCKSASCMRVLV